MVEYIKKSRIKEFFKAKGIQTSVKSLEVLDTQLEVELERIAERVNLSKMTTVKDRHI